VRRGYNPIPLVFAAVFVCISLFVAKQTGLLAATFFLAIAGLCLWAYRSKWRLDQGEDHEARIVIPLVLGCVLMSTAGFSLLDMILPSKGSDGTITGRFIDVQHGRGTTHNYEAVRLDLQDGGSVTLREERLWDLMADGKPIPVRVRITPILRRITWVAVEGENYDIKWRNQGPGSETLLYIALGGITFPVAGFGIWRKNRLKPANP
jgi:hypothetical protein